MSRVESQKCLRDLHAINAEIKKKQDEVNILLDVITKYEMVADSKELLKKDINSKINEIDQLIKKQIKLKEEYERNAEDDKAK